MSSAKKAQLVDDIHGCFGIGFKKHRADWLCTIVNIQTTIRGPKVCQSSHLLTLVILCRIFMRVNSVNKRYDERHKGKAEHDPGTNKNALHLDR